jgi:cytochrome c-type biogenesis protein CcmE
MGGDRLVSRAAGHEGRSTGTTNEEGSIVMKPKVIVGVLVVVVGIALGAVNFLDTNVEYGDFAAARKSTKKIQVKGEWVREMLTEFDAQKVTFTFYMKDDKNETARVVFNGACPNNFELATSLVAKGTFVNDEFRATDILTKCPSKYEGKSRRRCKRRRQPDPGSRL